jgi:hypothetical protein
LRFFVLTKLSLSFGDSRKIAKALDIFYCFNTKRTTNNKNNNDKHDHMKVYHYISPWVGNRIKNFSREDYLGRYKSNYQTIVASMVPTLIKIA